MSDIFFSPLLFAHLQIMGWDALPVLVSLVGFFGLLKLRNWVTKKWIRKHQEQPRSDRTKIALPLMISTPVTHEFSIRTYDVSLTGAFLSYRDLQNSMSFTSLIGKRTGIRCGDLIDIKILLGRFSYISCQARVVRHDLDADNPHPGIGLEFVNIGRRQRTLLAKLIYSGETSAAS